MKVPIKIKKAILTNRLCARMTGNYLVGAGAGAGAAAVSTGAMVVSTGAGAGSVTVSVAGASSLGAFLQPVKQPNAKISTNKLVIIILIFLPEIGLLLWVVPLFIGLFIIGGRIRFGVYGIG
jgi:hypothetical protein